MGEHKPEASNQTNDSLQRTLASQDVWTKGHCQTAASMKRLKGRKVARAETKRKEDLMVSGCMMCVDLFTAPASSDPRSETHRKLTN